MSENPEVIDLNEAMIPPPEAASMADAAVSLLREGYSVSEALARVDPAVSSTDVIENQCHAYSREQGWRCEWIAGHPGDHSVSFDWTDDECWTPGAEPVANQARTQLAPAPQHQPVAEVPAEVDHVSKEGTPIVYAPAPEVAEPHILETDKCASCEHPKSMHPGGVACACKKCMRYIPG